MTPPAMDVHLDGETDTTAIATPDPVLTNGQTHACFSIDDVAPHRAKSAPMPPGVAATTSSDMFKSPSCFKKPKARRWDHRVNLESSARTPSSLKGAAQFLKRPGLISLGGGLPSSDYFPFENISVKVPVPPHFSEQDTAKLGQALVAGKHDIKTGNSLYDLDVALNYGQATGAAQLLRFVTEHTEVVHNPPYSDWECCLTTGSTSALDTSFRMFCSRGDCILTEEYTFSSAVETARPMGINVLGVKMDADGMLPDDLDHILSNWDTSARTSPKPFLVYTVPTGQNPTGATQSLTRRKEIYAVAEKHDLCILEDEPYYFLQMDPYNTSRKQQNSEVVNPTSLKDFLSVLIPSFLSLDTSGRVLRLDSFSKIIAPGTRTGWVTGSSQIIERIVRHHEVSTQNPSGMAQIILFKLLDETWGHKGFLEWLMYMRVEYTRRRDIIVDACERHLPKEICSWVPPAAGMFHWINIDWTRHPTAKDKEYGATRMLPQVLEAIEDSIFHAAVDRGVLCSKGSWFRAEEGTDHELFFRTTFAAASAEQIEEAIRRFGEALEQEFGLEQKGAKRSSISSHVNGHAN